jgi:hypothetical protein
MSGGERGLDVLAYGQGMCSGKAALSISLSFKDSAAAVAASSEQALAAEVSFSAASSHAALAAPVQIDCPSFHFQIALKAKAREVQYLPRAAGEEA